MCELESAGNSGYMIIYSQVDQVSELENPALSVIADCRCRRSYLCYVLFHSSLPLFSMWWIMKMWNATLKCKSSLCLTVPPTRRAAQPNRYLQQDTFSLSVPRFPLFFSSFLLSPLLHIRSLAAAVFILTVRAAPSTLLLSTTCPSAHHSSQQMHINPYKE